MRKPKAETHTHTTHKAGTEALINQHTPPIRPNAAERRPADGSSCFWPAAFLAGKGCVGPLGTPFIARSDHTWSSCSPEPTVAQWGLLQLVPNASSILGRCQPQPCRRWSSWSPALKCRSAGRRPAGPHPPRFGCGPTLMKPPSARREFCTLSRAAILSALLAAGSATAMPSGCCYERWRPSTGALGHWIGHCFVELIIACSELLRGHSHFSRPQPPSQASARAAVVTGPVGALGS